MIVLLSTKALLSIKEQVNSHQILCNSGKLGSSAIEDENGIVFIVDNETGGNLAFMPKDVYLSIIDWGKNNIQ